MYKVLLADEEGLSLRSLRMIINADYSEDCEIRTALNVRQIKEIFSRFQPDLMFLNMQMPGIRGLSTLREFHHQVPSCHFIILSYRSRVDYGREGANLGIYDYLHKPFKPEQAKLLIKNCFSHITTEQKRDEITRYNNEKWEEAVPMIEGGLISEILFPDSHKSHIADYKAFLNIRQDYYWLCTLTYSQITEHGTMCNPIGSVVQLSNNYLYFRKVTKAFFPAAIIGPILANTVVFLVPCNELPLPEDQDAARKKRVEELTYQLHRKLNLRFRYRLSDAVRF